MEYTQRPAPSARWALHGSSCLVLSCRSATSTSRRCGSACQLDSRTGLAARTVRGCPPRSAPRRAARDRPPIQLCACRRRRRAGRGGVQRLDGRQRLSSGGGGMAATEKGTTSTSAPPAGAEHAGAGSPVSCHRHGPVPQRVQLRKLAKQAKAYKCNECGLEMERSQRKRCKKCNELLCLSCALQCRSCGRHFCTLTCAGWEIEMPSIEQQKQQEVPAPVTALHSSGGALGCKRCARRQRREGHSCETPDGTPKRRRTVYHTPV